MNSSAVTKAQVLKLAQKRYGAKAQLRHNPKALDAAAKAELREVARRRIETKKKLEEERKALVALGDPRKALREAARFAIDVDGDEPSWMQLREALEREERYTALSEEIRTLDAEGGKNNGQFSYRWEVIEIECVIPGFPVAIGHARADTLEELAAKLQED